MWQCECIYIALPHCGWVLSNQNTHTHTRAYKHNSNERQWVHAKEPLRHLFNVTFSPLHKYMIAAMWHVEHWRRHQVCGRDHIQCNECVFVCSCEFLLQTINRERMQRKKEENRPTHKNQSTKMHTHICQHRIWSRFQSTFMCVWYGSKMACEYTYYYHLYYRT